MFAIQVDGILARALAAPLALGSLNDSAKQMYAAGEGMLQNIRERMALGETADGEQVPGAGGWLKLPKDYADASGLKKTWYASRDELYAALARNRNSFKVSGGMWLSAKATTSKSGFSMDFAGASLGMGDGKQIGAQFVENAEKGAGILKRTGIQVLQMAVSEERALATALANSIAGQSLKKAFGVVETTLAQNVEPAYDRLVERMRAYGINPRDP